MSKPPLTVSEAEPLRGDATQDEGGRAFVSRCGPRGTSMQRLWLGASTAVLAPDGMAFVEESEQRAPGLPGPERYTVT